jgi:hypothetical protein
MPPSPYGRQASYPTTMKRAAQKYLTEIEKSGDMVADWMFKQFVAVLRNERVRISRKRRLVNPDDPRREVIRGLMDPDIHPSGRWVQILINPARTTHPRRDDEVGTLIHELTHVCMPRASERAVCSAERILMQKLSPAQRRHLKAFIPKHEVKRYPAVV